MLRLISRLKNDERGMSLVFVGMGFMSLLAASMLAIDVGMLMTARTQAQASADSGALAGALALVYDDFTNRSASGPAVQSAMNAATANRVMGNNISINPADVTFPLDPQGQPTRVQVTVHRTAARSNAVLNLIAPYFGTPNADVTATATAEAAPADAATCVKPWAVPDKWVENGNPPWDVNDTFDYYTNQQGGGTPLPAAIRDQYIPVTQANYSGYQANPTGPDYGRRIVIKPGNPNQAINASHFFPIAMPPNSGASWYETNIYGCWPGVMEIGDTIPVEPGNMTGPTTSGTQVLINRDPGAYWDTANRKVVSSNSPSPRVIVIPVFVRSEDLRGQPPARTPGHRGGELRRVLPRADAGQRRHRLHGAARRAHSG
jgi:hypothetical protein